MRAPGLLLVDLPLGGQVRIGAGGTPHHPHQRGDPVQDLAAVDHPQLDDAPRLGLLTQLLDPGAVQHRHRLVVAGGGHVHDVFEQRALVAEVEVHGLHGDAGALGHLVEQRRPVATGEEELGGRVDDAPAGGPGLLGAADAAGRCAVGFRRSLDPVPHSLEPTLVTR
ncbi:hypothetical protein GCM10010168_20430 [Actinoplanes ianthinogenes]|uniref:Uncharacterized protein n=1 Tax=Actinoplanes ianthinogenes TaxID=122358 RepID=A0ABM7M7U7_9ACTN|nr:hypothetical protein Aiant_83410 [Actinoplanes ianthinogenes]GGR03453.1 hypothetical protein GCM10010168_20430 [Actinoplanes ianthinogenes]